MKNSDTAIPAGQIDYSVTGQCTSDTINTIIDGIPGKNSFKVLYIYIMLYICVLIWEN